MERRLSAILAADVVGFTRLMRADEEGTLAALQAHRRELVDPLLVEHRGRLVKRMGDGALVEFTNAHDALRYAIAIQRGMEHRNADIPADRRIIFRIGVNLGDVIAEGDDIYGDGVNLASRLEKLAPPGGVAVSAAVRAQIGEQSEFVFRDLGERVVKTGDLPLRVALVEVTSVGASAATPLARGRPSIAVLPFANLGGDPDQDYFAEGIAEDLITELSKISGLFVVARQSSFALEPGARTPTEAGVRLRVGHVLEGSVRRSGDRLRLTARLVDTATGGQVWAERFDRTLTDIFAVQDEITRQIVAALEIRLLQAEQVALAQPPTAHLEAYNHYLRGLHLLGHHVRPSYELARRMFARAVELDPDFARALAGHAECDINLYLHCGVSVALDEVLVTASRAVELEPSLAGAHAARGVVLGATDRPEEAERAFREALKADPDHAGARYLYARACIAQGRHGDATRLLREAADLAPADVGYLNLLSVLHGGLGREADVVATARESLARCERQLQAKPESALASYTGALALANLGERERALEWAGRALAIEPDDHMTLYNVACVYAQLRMPEQAIDLLERAMPGASAHRQAWLRQDPDFDPLRDHPRFKALLARLSDG